MPRDWAESDYSRIYHTVTDDEKFADVFDDDRRWAAYTRLLMAADAAYPSPAALPRWVADDVLEHLVEVRIVELVRGSSYRIVGLRVEREGREGGRKVGGKVRSEGAERDEHGRFLPKTVDEPANDQQVDPAKASKPSNGTSNAPAGPASSSSLDEDEDETRRDERFSSSTTRGRDDVEALKARGWKRVSKAQIAVLDEIADRHDVTGYAFAAEAIRNAPEGTDPLQAVMAADKLWQRSRRDQADADDQAWQETKATERAEAGDAMTRIGEGLDAWIPR